MGRQPEPVLKAEELDWSVRGWREGAGMSVSGQWEPWRVCEQLPSQRNLSAREEKAPGRASYTHAAGGGHTGLSFLGYKMSSGADGMTAYLSLLPPNR